MTSIQVTHIGGPTVLLEIAGWRLLTDPTFDPPGRRYSFGWGTASHKLTGPAIAVSDLGPIDAVLLTHDHHADNLDDAGRQLLSLVDTVVTTTSAARRLDVPTTGLASWATTVLERPGLPTIHVTATPCRHGPPGSHPIVGDVIGFSLRWDGQRQGELWISGDTVHYRGVRQVADRLDIGTAIIHLGGVRFPITGPVRYTMTAGDAVELLTAIDPAVIVPVHYEGWSHFREPRTDVDRAFAAAPATFRDKVHWATPGQAMSLRV